MHRLDLFPSKEMIYQYRAAFSTPAGRAALNHILYDLGVFQEITDGPEDVALKNYGIRLLKILGGGEIDGIEEFTKLLMKQPLKGESQ